MQAEQSSRGNKRVQEKRGGWQVREIIMRDKAKRRETKCEKEEGKVEREGLRTEGVVARKEMLHFREKRRKMEKKSLRHEGQSDGLRTREK